MLSENSMINHTIQPENVKRFVNLNRLGNVKEFYFALIIDIDISPGFEGRSRGTCPAKPISLESL